MQLPSLALAVALALMVATPSTTVSAANCTDAQLAQLENVNTSAVHTACPTLFSTAGSTLNTSRIEVFTAEALKKMEPCKEKTCLDELQKLVDSAPDCTSSGLNPRATYGVSVTLCRAFNDGEVTVEKATEFAKNFTKNVTHALWGDDTLAPSPSPSPVPTRTNAGVKRVVGVAVVVAALATSVLL